MPAGAPLNRRIVLAAHPQGLPTLHDFRLETQPVPTPAEGQAGFGCVVGGVLGGGF